ncbi:hypothetical protein M9Y10_027037 [Tritrichomonas musculus]|uniref:Surface antigen BspA-like n=1 Tax=Tritrichomonas musculus TaxID=1915356 RepID=A0ABR2H5D5_9EUKA
MIVPLFLLIISTTCYNHYDFKCTADLNDNCPNIAGTSVKILSTDLKEGKYCRCTKYGEIDFEFDAGVGYVPKNYFYGAYVKTVKIPKGLTEIREGAFDGTHLNKIEFADFADSSLQTIGNGAFYDVQLPTTYTLELPKNVVTIGDSVFYSVEIDILDLSETGLTYNVGSNLCDSATIKTVKFPKTLTNLGSSAFINSNLGTVDLSGLTSTLNVNEDMCYNAVIKSLIFPEKISSLSGKAFQEAEIGTLDCKKTTNLAISGETFKSSSIKTLVLPNNLNSVSDSSFKECTITNLDLSNVKSEYFPSGIFNKAEIKGEITFHKDLTSIWPSSFKGSTIASLDLTKYTKITSIGSKAFQDAKITSAVLNNVDEIFDNAFDTCPINIEFSKTKLKNIHNYAFKGSEITPTDQIFPNTLKLIGQKAFYETKLTSIVLSKNDNELKIDQSAFENVITLVQATIHAKNIESEAFSGCVNMRATEITIEGSGNIQDSAFENCYNLSCKLTVAPAKDKKPNDQTKLVYTTISSKAFQNSGIESIELPEVEKIDSYAFQNCTKLIGTGSINAVTIEQQAFEDDYQLNFDSITAKIIKSKAFQNCRSLTSKITLIKDDTHQSTIGSYAFAYCGELQELTFITRDGLDIPTFDADEIDKYKFTVSDHAFYQSGLKGDLIIPFTLETIDEYSFAYCSKLTSLTIEGEHYIHKNIKQYAFYRSGISKPLIIPNSVVNIGKYAFAYCPISDLTIYGSNHIVPKKIEGCIEDPLDPMKCYEDTDGTVVSEYAFYRCSNLNHLKLEGSDVIFKEDSFKECPIKNLEILGNLKEIPERAFYGMDSIDKPITIPDSVTKINNFAFAGCTKLPTVTFTENSQLTDINQGAFYGCSSLTKTNIPNGVTSISPYTYYGCNLESISLPTKLKKVDQYAFYGCKNLKSQLVLPPVLESVEGSAFRDCGQLKGPLNFPHSTTSIGDKAFLGCYSLNGDLSFGRKINNIGTDAFRGCSGFTGSLTFPEFLDFVEDKNGEYVLGSVSINQGAFYGCSNFKGKLTLPQNTQFDGPDAFRDCSSFTGDLIISEFSKFDDSATNTFRNCTGFNGKLVIKNIDLTSIPDGTFHGCSNLNGEIPISNIEKLGKSAFYDCSKLTGPLHLKMADIPDYAFYNCQGLNGELTCEKQLETIGEYAFYKCSGLTGNPDFLETTEIKKYGFAGCSGLSGPLEFSEKLTKLGEFAFSDCSGFSDYLKFTVGTSLHIQRSAFKDCSGFKKGTLSFVMDSNEETLTSDKNHYKYPYFLKIENDAFEKTKFSDIYYLGRFEPDCDYDIGISSIKGIHTSSNYANKTFCNNPLHKSKLSGGAIAGIVIAVIVVVAAIVAVIVFLIIRNKKNKDQSEAEVEMNQDP